MFLLCAWNSDEQIEGGWGGGGEAVAEHLTSGMLHLHGQLVSKPVADLRGGVRGVRPPPPSTPPLATCRLTVNS